MAGELGMSRSTTVGIELMKDIGYNALLLG